MKFMDRVLTPNGPGLLVARAEGGYLVAIARQDVTGAVCPGPCLHLIVKDKDITPNPTSGGSVQLAGSGSRKAGGNGRS